MVIIRIESVATKLALTLFAETFRREFLVVPFFFIHSPLNPCTTFLGDEEIALDILSRESLQAFPTF